jgi:hypothetical protein
MSKPVGVTASAVVAILGSILALLFTAGAIASLFIVTAQPQPPNSAQFVIAGAAMFAILGGLGIWTSVGLFRLRSWARTSILVFAGFLAACSIVGLISTMAMPLPPEMAAGTGPSFRLVTAVMFGIPLAIAVWWLIQFNTRSTKAAFASPLPEAAPQRPMSITVIAWAFIIGTASCLFLIPTHVPVFLFGAILNGWIAGVIYAFFAALSLYIGKGLLDLRERARVLAIAWFGFGFVHMTVVALVPSLRQRMLELQRTLELQRMVAQQHPIAFDQGMMTSVMLGFTAILIASAIWFLVRNRAAFVLGESIRYSK